MIYIYATYFLYNFWPMVSLFSSKERQIYDTLLG